LGVRKKGGRKGERRYSRRRTKQHKRRRSRRLDEKRGEEEQTGRLIDQRKWTHMSLESRLSVQLQCITAHALVTRTVPHTLIVFGVQLFT
jgi:hypothetical protein